MSQNLFVMGSQQKGVKRKFPNPESEESRLVASETGFGEATRASAQPAPSPATGWVKHWNKES